jgi:predicted  nucleic acid-binding Zn-ribbon protein
MPPVEPRRSSSQPPPIRRAPSVPPPIPGSGPHHANAQAASQFGGDTFVTDNDFSRPQIQALLTRDATEPPPTRIRTEAMVDRPFTPSQVLAIPEIPEPGLVKAARYAYIFARARWQRRGAIKQLGLEIRQDTDALDQVLGALGAAARAAHVEGRVFSAENSAIADAQERINNLNKEGAEVEGRKAEENSKFVDVERERNAKLTEAERMVGEAQSELANLEAQRRSLRDKRKELERRLKAYLKAADDHDRQAGSAPLGDQRQELRRVSEGHRKEAAALEPERQDIDRKLGSIERPINEVIARLDAGKAELDAAKRSLNDAREGHTHRLAELDAEQKRKTREIGLAESEIQRRLVTLGTLVNLNRIEDPRFAELYTRIDRLRGAITARTTEIEKLTAEREAYDRGTLVRGVATIGGAILILIALIVIVAAIL